MIDFEKLIEGMYKVFKEAYTPNDKKEINKEEVKNEDVLETMDGVELNKRKEIELDKNNEDEEKEVKEEVEVKEKEEPNGSDRLNRLIEKIRKEI